MENSPEKKSLSESLKKDQKASRDPEFDKEIREMKPHWFTEKKDK